MAVVTFSAAKQTTFTTPIEGTDAVGGLTVTRANQTANNSAVLTVNSLAIAASVANSYGVYINAPAVEATYTLTNAYGAYITAPSGSGTRTNAYTLRLEAPTGAATSNYSLLADGAAKIAAAIDTASTSFNLINTTAVTVNIAGAATTLSIGASSGTTTVNNDLNLPTGKTFKINGATVLSATSLGTNVVSSSLTSVGIITSGTWQSNTAVGVAYGGTGTTTGSITGTGALTFTAGGSDQNVVLDPSGIGTVDVSGARITSVGTPTQSTDAVTKAYVDTYRTGVDVKDSVHVATTADITSTIANAGSSTSWTIDGHDIYAASFTGSINGNTLTASSVTGTIDVDQAVLGASVENGTYIVQQLTGTTGGAGTYQVSISHNVTAVAMTSGSRVLVKNQGTGSENGIYITQTSAWIRSYDFPSGISASVTPGLFVFTSFGTTNGSIGFVLQDPGTSPINVGVTTLSFSQFSGAGQVQVSAPLLKSGNTLSIDTTVVATSTNTLTLSNKTIAYSGIGFNDNGGTPNKITLSAPSSLAGNIAVVLPSTADTLVGKNTTDIFTNKTFNTGATGNVFQIAGVGITATTGTGSVVLASSPSLTSPSFSTIVNTGTLTLPTTTDYLVGRNTTDIFTNKTFDTAGSGNVFRIAGTSITATTGSNSVVLSTSPSLITPSFSSIVNTGTLTLPTSTDVLVGRDTIDIFTNKTFDTAGSGNVFRINGNQISGYVGSGADAVLSSTPTITTPNFATSSTQQGFEVFQSQGSVSAPTSTDLRLYNKSGSLYVQNTTAEYQLLHKGNAPFYNLGSSSAAPAAQYRRVGMYILYGQTTNASVTRLTSGGGANVVTPSSSNVVCLPSGIDSTWFTKIYITACNTDDHAGAAWEVSAVFRKTATAGSLALLGDPVVIAAADNGQTALEITVQVDNVISDSIDIRVKGLTGKTINWVVNIQTTEAG